MRSEPQPNQSSLNEVLAALIPALIFFFESMLAKAAQDQDPTPYHLVAALRSLRALAVVLGVPATGIQSQSLNASPDAPLRAPPLAPPLARCTRPAPRRQHRRPPARPATRRPNPTPATRFWQRAAAAGITPQPQRRRHP